jgi:hypothetical protein
MKAMNKNLARKINRMAREDSAMRKGHKKGELLDARVDQKNTAALKMIIKQYGWPTISLVGKMASFNAWLIAQHADHDRKFQKTVLKLLKKINSESRDINPANIAYLTDRLLVAKKKNQRFGTQFDFDAKGRLKLHPIQNRMAVDALRKKYNLSPIRNFLDMAEDFNAKQKQQGTADS